MIATFSGLLMIASGTGTAMSGRHSGLPHKVSALAFIVCGGVLLVI